MPIYLLSPSTILVVEVIIKLKNMIDDKKIEGAKDSIFNKHFLKNNEGMICIDHISEPVYLDYQIKQAIELGANWAINELLKDLWHPSSEKPKKGCVFLYKTIFKGYGVNQIIDGNEWKYIIKYQKATQWLYIDDLFSKEGDE